MTKRNILFAAALIGLSAGAASATSATSASPIEGRWRKGNLQIQIAPCGRVLCGTVVKASAKQQAKAERGSGTDLIGATLIRDIRRTGANSYGARVFLADRNISARGTIQQVSPNRLAVRGCVLGVICKSSNWVRVR